jgi:hypothetical protein|tara:strand:- start:372 stop:803 length:432 start_codon:yes stop_codon:yes gene_type:complete
MRFEKCNNNKVTNWSTKVFDFCNEINLKPFLWNERDCFSIICSVVDVMYNTNYYEEQLKYKRTPRSAIKFYKDKQVYNSLLEIGFKKEKDKSQVGDVYYKIDENGKECTAINLYSHVLMANEKDGFYTVRKKLINDNLTLMRI